MRNKNENKKGKQKSDKTIQWSPLCFFLQKNLERILLFYSSFWSLIKKTINPCFIQIIYLTTCYLIPLTNINEMHMQFVLYIYNLTIWMCDGTFQKSAFCISGIRISYSDHLRSDETAFKNKSKNYWLIC